MLVVVLLDSSVVKVDTLVGRAGGMSPPVVSEEEVLVELVVWTGDGVEVE